MYQITYLSSALELFTEAELKELLRKAVVKNSALKLTGMLLYIDGNFIQILEGDKKNVLELFEIISFDRRHQSVIKLLERTIDERNFPDWTMGFKSLTMSEASHLSGYKNLKNDIFNTEIFKNTEHPAIKLLKTFYSNSRL